MSAPICPVHGEGFGTPCYLCVDAENRTLRERYAEAVMELHATNEILNHKATVEGQCECSHRGGMLEELCEDCARIQSVRAVLSRPEAQEVLRG